MGCWFQGSSCGVSTVIRVRVGRTSQKDQLRATCTVRFGRDLPKFGRVSDDADEIESEDSWLERVRRKVDVPNSMEKLLSILKEYY